MMNSLKLDATRDAGRFAYHLKSLLNSDLIEPDVETKKYRLTNLGQRIIEITDEIDERTHKRRKMLVRTSHLSIEEFDRNKIMKSLINEANVPTDIAQKVARETEKRLQQFKTKHITAPLIREIVNSILLEKHYEEYRHNLTRLGLPVNEVAQLIDTPILNGESVLSTAGNAVMEEYTLLSILPRDLSDAYLSGNLHISNLGQWILKPNEIVHDLSSTNEEIKPKTLEAAFNLVINIIRNTAMEVMGQQILDDFNVYMAPFTHAVNSNKIKRLIRLFINDLNQRTPTPTTITLESLIEKSISHPQETHDFTFLLLETLAEENQKKPIRNPKIVMKFRPGTMRDGEESLLYELHRLAAISPHVYIANLWSESSVNVTYTASGSRLADDWLGDRDLDIQRTGNLDTVFINLPRVSFEAERNEDKFFELLDNLLETTKQALDTKYKAIKKRMDKNLFPSLSYKVNGASYFRSENATRTIAAIGLDESIQALLGEKDAQDYDKASLKEKVVKYIYKYSKKHAKKPRNRLTTAIVPNITAARRFARLDVEKYGRSVVKTQGSKVNPLYSDISRFYVQESSQLDLEEQLHQLTPGGHLTLLGIENSQLSGEKLLVKTKELVARKIGFFAYNLLFRRCLSCKTDFKGVKSKCPNCGSTRTMPLSHFS
jgi:ribonucleoside-triphosphate reductase